VTRTALVLAAALVAAIIPATTAVGAARAATTPSRPAARRPNIVFILTDDLDASTYDPATFPALHDLMTTKGLTFTKYYVDDSLCCPSRASILRGQYVHNTDVRNNAPPTGGFERFHAEGRERSTIATWLHARGYRTGLFGKYLNGYPNTVSPRYVPPGWDTWVSPSGGNPYAEYQYELNQDGRLVEYGRQPADYLVDVLSEQATRFIASSSGRPFFAYIAPYVPHQPATPAPRYLSSFPGVTAPQPPSFDRVASPGSPAYLRDRPPLSAVVKDYINVLYRRRLQDMLGVDDLVRNVVQTLRRTGQLDNTYIFLSSDNGFHLGQHRLPPGKQTPFEEDIHVPLVVRGPGVRQGTTSAMAMNIDLAPTFAALAGARATSPVDGRSLVPLFHAAGAPPVWRQNVLVEHYGHVDVPLPGRAPTTTDQPDRYAATSPVAPRDPDNDEGFNRAATGARPRPARLPLRSLNAFGVAVPEYYAVRTSRYLYVEYVDGERQLFDTRVDPFELNNLTGDQWAGLTRDLSQRLHALELCAGRSCRRAEDMVGATR
jgi:arylsulfatase A-like enzyme